MNEHLTEEVPAAPPAPKKRRGPNKKKRVARAKPAAPKPVNEPVRDGEFAGVSATTCCAACTPERCVISTVDICKHPFKTADSGCGPVTMKNRLRVRKLLKHQMIDLAGG